MTTTYDKWITNDEPWQAPHDEYDPPCQCGVSVSDHPTIYVTDEIGDYETQACPGSIVCALCDAHLFVAGVEHGSYIWSHLEDTGCDDPVPTTTKA